MAAKKNVPFPDAPDQQAIRQLAGASYFSRGLDYYSQGRVSKLTPSPAGGVQARVSGAALYRVGLWRQGDGLIGYRCDCPMGQGLAFCKHCVAVALAWIDAAPPRAEVRRVDNESERLWNLFSSNPNIYTYEVVKRYFATKGTGEEFRTRALLDVRQRLEIADAREKVLLHELLIEVFLAEGDSHAALIEAKTGGCAPAALAQVADHLMPDRPLEAGEIYLDLADQMISVKLPRDERLDPIELIYAGRDAYARGRQMELFREKIEALRERCGTKRAVVRVIDSLLLDRTRSKGRVRS